MYLFPENINYCNFFRMNRSLVIDKHWSKLSLASKAIYPTIGIHCDSKGKAFPSQETIGIMTGCDPKTVRAGLKGLSGFPGFSIHYSATRRGHRSCKYSIQPSIKQKGASVWIYRSFYEGGNWRQISNKAKAVYPVLLAFSFFDYDLYYELSGNDCTEYEQSEFFFEGCYEQRDFDIADPEIEVLAEYAGVNERSVNAGLIELDKNHFLERDSTYFKLFRRPPYQYKREWLNSEIRKFPNK